MVETSPTARRPRRRSTWRRIALQVAIGVGALAVFFWRVDVGGVLAELTRIDPRWAAGALAVFTASKVLHAWRWWSFLGERAAGVAPLAGIFLVGNMANSLLPLRAGDLLRVEVPSRRFGIPRSTLVSSVFVVESVLDLFAFAVLLVVALLLADLPPVLQPLVWSVGVAAILLFVALVGLARGREALVPLTARLLRPLPDRAGAWIAERIPPFVDGMNSLRTNVQAARVVAVSLAAWLVEVVVY
ncbi:MAG: lysylphosphatidylglycerol synthase domain-containing protein, partial [Dehalococcoidia bacterium]